MTDAPNPESHANPPRLAKRVLLIGWDGADWRMITPLLEQGLMPNLQKLIDRGMMGNVASLTPMLSPILWTSIATGKHADKHGILGFTEPDESGSAIRPVTSTSRRCKAIWNILSDAGLRAGAINWFASHPAEPINGFVVTDRYPTPIATIDKPWPPVANSVHPAELLEELCDLRIHPSALTPQQLLPFIADPTGLEKEQDPNLNQLCSLLAHCASVHAATTWFMETEEWDFLGVYYDTVDRFGHAFMEYHPPRMPHVPEKDFNRYRDTMIGCYRFHDMMLGRKLELAGEDTTVIILSDHGFYSDELRPEGSAKIEEGAPVAWHRPYGILLMAGPGIRQDERVYGASLLDITPTTLWLLGQPVAADMDGNPLIQIAADPNQRHVERIPTYEDGSTAASQAAAPLDVAADAEMLARLVELGYVDKNDTVDNVITDRMRNLAQVYAATDRPRKALEEFQRVLVRTPEDKGIRVAIANCHLAMNNVDECERILTEVLADDLDSPYALTRLGTIRFHQGRVDEALDLLLKSEKVAPPSDSLHNAIGRIYMARNHLDDAERAFRKALEIDRDSAEAYDGLGLLFRARKRPAEAVQAHMQSIALLHYRPQTHINLGLALAETQQFEWAVRAFNVAIEMGPRNPFPHRCLAELYARVLNDPAKAQHHWQQATALHQATVGAQSNVKNSTESQDSADDSATGSAS